jgi:hypothetical protein
MKASKGLVFQTIFNNGLTFSRAFKRSRHVRSGAGSEPREAKEIGPVLTRAVPTFDVAPYACVYPEAWRNKLPRPMFRFAIK